MIRAEDFKIRCSSIGKIMGQPRSKKERDAGELSQTAKSHCDEWIHEKVYGRKREFKSKYTDKGNIVENESIQFIGEMLEIPFIEKNDVGFENDYMTGTCDILLANTIIDAKSSWDSNTFPLLKKSIPDMKYWWQLQGYLEGYDKEHAILAYVLINTPEELIKKEAYWFSRDNGYEFTPSFILERFRDKMTFDDIEDKYKIKTFSFDRDRTVPEQIEGQVIKCRKYISEQLKTL